MVSVAAGVEGAAESGPAKAVVAKAARRAVAARTALAVLGVAVLGVAVQRTEALMRSWSHLSQTGTILRVGSRDSLCLSSSSGAGFPTLHALHGIGCVSQRRLRARATTLSPMMPPSSGILLLTAFAAFSLTARDARLAFGCQLPSAKAAAVASARETAAVLLLPTPAGGAPLANVRCARHNQNSGRAGT